MEKHERNSTHGTEHVTWMHKTCKNTLRTSAAAQIFAAERTHGYVLAERR